jgi:mono/diheme cytochrome c family protein
VKRRVLAVLVLAGLCIFAGTSLAAAAGVPGNPKVGKTLFLQAGVFCGSCHTLKAAKSTGRDGPNLDSKKLSYAAILNAITTGNAASKRWPTGMPRYGGRTPVLPTRFIRDVAAFVYDATHG